MNRIASALAFAAFAGAVVPVAGALPADDFNDNARGPEWSLVQDDPATLALAETSNRLEVRATNPTSPNTDALYLSTGPAGFRLSTAADFAIAIDYSFPAFAGSVDGGALGLVFGVGRDLAGTDSAAVGLGYADAGIIVPRALTVAHRTDDVQTQPVTDLVNAPASGTFLITYNAAADALSLGLDGAPVPAFVLPKTVRGLWSAADLLVSFGARGSGFTTTSGQASLDDFVVRTGTVVPEPGVVVLMPVALAILVARGRAARRSFARRRAPRTGSGASRRTAQTPASGLSSARRAVLRYSSERA